MSLMDLIVWFASPFVLIVKHAVPIVLFEMLLIAPLGWFVSKFVAVTYHSQPDGADQVKPEVWPHFGLGIVAAHLLAVVVWVVVT